MNPGYRECQESGGAHGDDVTTQVIRGNEQHGGASGAMRRRQQWMKGEVCLHDRAVVMQWHDSDTADVVAVEPCMIRCA